ncbi:polymer-forming cytoskeletal protein [Candidatus Methylacidiphilum infernorum]|uniref:Polymer-forming cytoskeletal protein n=1 Tax=Candidatus Methylacidiphilum infernorum TaxID=511746 RepID=A0ABX7PTK8_9BACT|nr:polymer-forming cytoskeletal protein [Candidatus Methylacidiphilum infernorum]QSR86018.1 polymer-forming cytoskeletal protein [Candidatus Methylacidiphilum infernorum]
MQNKNDHTFLSPSITLEGELWVKEKAVVNCHFHGRIRVDGKLEILSGAVIEGEVYAQAIEIDAGAIINGKIVIGKSKPNN